MKYLMISLLFLFETSAFANDFVSVGGDVKFTAVGKPGFLKIRGESKGEFPKGKLNFKDNAMSGDFLFDLEKLDTGIDLRNEHMKDKYLEVKKFPRAKLTLKGIPIKESELKGNIETSFKGVLSLHGEVKDIEGKFKYTAAEKKSVANFTIKVSDFKIDVPKYMGITVSETVDVEVVVILKEEK